MAKKLFTVDGISAKIDERIFTDYRLAELQVEISEPLPEEGEEGYMEAAAERGKLSTKLVSLVLGSEKENVMNQIAKKNDGFIPAEYVSEWIGKVFQESQKAKN